MEIMDYAYFACLWREGPGSQERKEGRHSSVENILSRKKILLSRAFKVGMVLISHFGSV